MDSIFRVPYEALRLDDVRKFLSDAGNEGITWETKGPRPDRPDDPLHPRHIREAACGIANSLGGFIILGATQAESGGEWSLPGVRINHPEPGTWIDDVIGTLRPRPRIRDPQVWPLDNGRLVGVIEVEPIAVPPCMTPGGEIYERTSGKTVRVTDPLVLARLMDAGVAARVRAEAGTVAAIEGLRPWTQDKSVNVYVTLCATGYNEDISRRLFADATPTDPAMAHRIDDIVSAQLKPDRYHQGPSAISRIVRQDAHIHFTGPGAFANDPKGGDHLWVVRCAWDGSAGVRCAGNEPDIGIDLLLGDLIVPAWHVASEIVPLLGGIGPAHLRIDILDGFNLLGAHMGPLRWPRTVVQRWLDDPAPSDEVVESIRRELLRAAGHTAWEPPAPDQ